MGHVTKIRSYSSEAKVCFLKTRVAPLQEWLYREEFEQYEKEGVLQMHTAFSREQAGTPKLNLSWEFLAIIEG